METTLLGLAIGGLFGAGLYLAGLAEPDKIIGTLRLKDFHALRTIAVFVLVGMGGTWVLAMNGLAHWDIKPATLPSVLLGGGLLGIGFGMTGYCPGTGLSCAISGRFDALVTVLGMLLGALGFILVYPHVVPAMEGVADFGNKTLPEMTGTDAAFWVVPIVAIGTLLLLLTRPRKAPPQSE
jgi:uncharacterized membrane protein YedE/YeeE